MPHLGRLELNKSNLSRLDDSMTTKNKKKVSKNHQVLAEETSREVSSII